MNERLRVGVRFVFGWNGIAAGDEGREREDETQGDGASHVCVPSYWAYLTAVTGLGLGRR